MKRDKKVHFKRFLLISNGGYVLITKENYGHKHLYIHLRLFFRPFRWDQSAERNVMAKMGFYPFLTNFLAKCLMSETIYGYAHILKLNF